jgi:hypothetical protein
MESSSSGTLMLKFGPLMLSFEKTTLIASSRVVEMVASSLMPEIRDSIQATPWISRRMGCR